jgi:hypothetical protein
MHPGDLLVTLVGRVPYGALVRVLQPPAQVLPELEALGVEEEATLAVGERIAVLRNALWAIVLLPLVVYVIQVEVIEREERYLERTFGEEYLAYKARVRRWV